MKQHKIASSSEKLYPQGKIKIINHMVSASGLDVLSAASSSGASVEVGWLI